MKSRRAVPCTLLIALLAGCAHTGLSAADRDAGPMAQAISMANFDNALLATAIFDETNRARAANRVTPLKRSPELDAAANEQVFHMALVLRVEHDNPIPGEHTVAERIARTGLAASRVGENALMFPARRPAEYTGRDYTYAELAAVLVENWMGSPAHRANILDSKFTLLGCAASLAHGTPGGDRVFAAQDFCLPFSTASTAAR